MKRDVFWADLEREKVSNHTSVVDDPVMWGVLPWRYLMDREGNRWSLGSHDICFTGR